MRLLLAIVTILMLTSLAFAGDVPAGFTPQGPSGPEAGPGTSVAPGSSVWDAADVTTAPPATCAPDSAPSGSGVVIAPNPGTSVPGPSGVTGNPGSPGARGSRGSRSSRGSAGPMGPQGQQGLPGQVTLKTTGPIESVKMPWGEGVRFPINNLTSSGEVLTDQDTVLVEVDGFGKRSFKAVVKEAHNDCVILQVGAADWSLYPEGQTRVTKTGLDGRNGINGVNGKNAPWWPFLFLLLIPLGWFFLRPQQADVSAITDAITVATTRLTDTINSAGDAAVADVNDARDAAIVAVNAQAGTAAATEQRLNQLVEAFAGDPAFDLSNPAAVRAAGRTQLGIDALDAREEAHRAALHAAITAIAGAGTPNYGCACGSNH